MTDTLDNICSVLITLGVVAFVLLVLSWVTWLPTVGALWVLGVVS